MTCAAPVRSSHGRGAGGPPSGLDDAVALWRRASRIIPPDSAHLGAVMSNLGVALRELWERDGRPAILDEAVAAATTVVAASGQGVADATSARVQLGKTLWRRFAERRRREELEAAIAALDEAAAGAATPVSADCHEALGNARFDRYALAGARSDLDGAVEHLRRAVELTPDDSEDASVYWSNLASALLDRFESGGARDDLDEAIRLLDTAVAASGGADGASTELLTNLGNALRLRAAADRRLNDTERAVELLARLVDAERDDRRRAGKLNNFAAGLLQRFDMMGESRTWTRRRGSSTSRSTSRRRTTRPGLPG
jgi:tetratricopeptide (TPR) repeat protein